MPIPYLQPATVSRIDAAFKAWRAQFGRQLAYFAETAELDRLAEREMSHVLLALELARLAEGAAEDCVFTAKEVMDNPEGVAARMGVLRELRALAELPEIREILDHTRALIRKTAAEFGAEGKVEACVTGLEIGSLIQSAEQEMSRLRVHQFAQGEGRAPAFHLNGWIYGFATMHELVCALARQPVDGLTLCLLTDAEIPEYSVFAWALKTGTTLTVLSEDNGLSHNEQKHLRRNPGRDFERRAAGRHYPYSIFNFEETPTASGSGSQLRIRSIAREGADSTQLAVHDTSAHRIRRIQDLEPAEIVWLILVAFQIHRTYWLEERKTPELAYTGAMLDEPDAVPQALAQAPGSQSLFLPEAGSLASASPAPYTPLALDVLDAARMGGIGEDRKNWEGPDGGRTGCCDWLVRRYGDQVNFASLSLPPKSQLALPQAEHPGDDNFFARCDRRSRGEPELPLRPVVPVTKDGTITTQSTFREHGGWVDGPVTYEIAPFRAGALYGTKEEIQREQFYIARRNQATAIQALADREFAATAAETVVWFQARVRGNLPALKAAIAQEKCEIPTAFHPADTSFTNRQIVRPHNILALYQLRDGDEEPHYSRLLSQVLADLHCGIVKKSDWHYRCVEEPANRGRCLAQFTPIDAASLAFLTGVPVGDLPEYLQHWRHPQYPIGYTGNPILNLIDPVERLRNPWSELRFVVQLHFTRRTFKRWQQGQFQPDPPELQCTHYPQYPLDQLLHIIPPLSLSLRKVDHYEEEPREDRV